MASIPIPPTFPYLATGSIHGLHAYHFGGTADVPFAVSQKLYSLSYVDQYNNAKFNPLDCVISCHQVPVAPSVVPFKVSSFVSAGQSWDIGQEMDEFRVRYATHSCGSISIPRSENNAEDFNKRITLHLPFCSSIEIPAVFCVGGTIEIQYTVDCLTGDCIAHALTTNSSGESALFSSTGNCAVSIPLVSQIDKTRMNVANSVVSSVASITGAVLSKSPASIMGAITNAYVSNQEAQATPVTTTSTQISGNVSAMDYRTPYVTIVTPRTSNHYSYVGGQAEGVVTIGSCTGYMKFKNVDLGALKSRANENIWATAEELAMLEEMLKQGVFA